MARCAIFIDGGYLDKADAARGLRIHLGKVGDSLAGQDERLRTYYYHCMPYQGNPPTLDESRRYGAARAYFDRLRGLDRFEVRFGKLIKIPLANGNFEFQQKQVDVLLSVDLVELAATKQIQSVSLLAGDSDFIPAVQAAKRHGVLVKLFHCARYSRDLWNECDSRTLLAQADFAGLVRP